MKIYSATACAGANISITPAIIKKIPIKVAKYIGLNAYNPMIIYNIPSIIPKIPPHLPDEPLPDIKPIIPAIIRKRPPRYINIPTSILKANIFPNKPIPTIIPIIPSISVRILTP